MNEHISVFLKESIQKLNIKQDGLYIDATLGRGGHSSEILKRLNKGKLFCFDKDLQAIEETKRKLSKINLNFKIIHSDFSNIDKVRKLEDQEFDGILFDLGVSSPQLDEQERGFSYHNDGPLDMRMDTTNPLTAEVIVNTYSKEKLIKIFKEYGEDKFSVKVASSIVEYRANKKIVSTLELVDIIKNSKPEWAKVKKHPAKQIFQAIRIEVNDELNAIKISLEKSLNLIKVGGKIVVITFHSLEDKIVKEVFYKAKQENIETVFEIQHKFRTTKTLHPSNEEVTNNKRSKSARLREIIRNY